MTANSVCARSQVNRIEDYGTWYREFKAALEGLDVKRQQASPLPIIYQWAKPTPGKSGTKCVRCTAHAAPIAPPLLLLLVLVPAAHRMPLCSFRVTLTGTERVL